MPSRARKAVVGGVVAIATVTAGVAFASFVSSEEYGGNAASGGHLTVDTSGLPLAFSGNQALYPTECANPDPGAVMTSSFTITDNNPVSASYGLKASIGDATHPTPTADESAQYDNLCIKITVTTPGTTTHTVSGQTTPLDKTGSPSTKVLYDGKLKGLDGSVADLLGTIAKGQTQTYDVRIALQNVPGTEQAQDVTTPFTLTVRAETPVTSSTTSTTTAA